MITDGLERSPFGGTLTLVGDVRIDPSDADDARAYLARKGETGLTEMLGL